MSLVNIYTDNIFEFKKVGYYENNSRIKTSKGFPNFYFKSSESSATVYLYEINTNKLKYKNNIETLIDSEACSVENEKVYYLGYDSDMLGTFRYIIIGGSGVKYWSEMFCIKEQNTTVTFNTMKSGLMKFYDADFMEWKKPGYYENNTKLRLTGFIPSFYFDTELTIDSVVCDLYQLSKFNLKYKRTNERKIKSLTLSEEGSEVHYQKTIWKHNGIYRIITTITPTVGDAKTFYGELFCVKHPQDLVLNSRQFADGSFRQFIDGTYREFVN